LGATKDIPEDGVSDIVSDTPFEEKTMSIRGAWLLVAGLGLLAWSQPAYADEFQLEKGFIRLDNGKNLEGWTGRLDGWSVVDGAIQLNARKARGHIFAEKKHSKDCIIRLEFRATPRADSGIYIHGKQLQCRDYPTAGPKNYAKACKPAGEWNDLELDISDGVAVIKLNGEVIEKAWKIGNKDQGLGLQKERGDFAFRYIRIKEKK
jgi:hypothetical protein